MVKKIPSDDRRAMYKSSDRRVSRDELAQFVKGKHRVERQEPLGDVHHAI